MMHRRDFITTILGAAAGTALFPALTKASTLKPGVKVSVVDESTYVPPSLSSVLPLIEGLKPTFIDEEYKDWLLQLVMEPNDARTRLLARSMTVDKLNALVRSGEIYDYAVLCDEWNNPPTVIDDNDLVINVITKPTATSTEYPCYEISLKELVAERKSLWNA